MARRPDWSCLSNIGWLVVSACATSGPPPAAGRPVTDEPAAAVAPTTVQADQLPALSPAASPAIVAVDPATAPRAEPFPVPKAIAAVVGAKDRTEADRAL